MSTVITLSKTSIYPSPNTETPILRDVSFSVETGELLYIVGRVGSGKTSLLRTICGEIPFEGTIKVCGYYLDELTTRKKYKLKRLIGVVFQEHNLIEGMSVYKNLEFVLRATDWKKERLINQRINEVLEMVGMTQKAYSLPSELSGGERQRICIARALLNSPQLILADEPTANLDPVAATDVVSLFKSLANSGECAVVISTHNSESLRLAPSRTLRCAEGFVEQV